MKKGLGTVTCGHCGKRLAVVWPGHKYKMKCLHCGKTMSIHRQRLKNFETLKVQEVES